MFLEENRANAKCSLLGAGGCALESESLEFKPHRCCSPAGQPTAWVFASLLLLLEL